LISSKVRIPNAQLESLISTHSARVQFFVSHIPAVLSSCFIHVHVLLKKVSIYSAAHRERFVHFFIISAGVSSLRPHRLEVECVRHQVAVGHCTLSMTRCISSFCATHFLLVAL
jgi:hypothetical protein